MKNGIFIGMAIGLATGAAIVASNKKARQMVSGAQEQIMHKFKSMQSASCTSSDCNCDEKQNGQNCECGEDCNCNYGQSSNNEFSQDNYYSENANS